MRALMLLCAAAVAGQHRELRVVNQTLDVRDANLLGQVTRDFGRVHRPFTRGY